LGGTDSTGMEIWNPYNGNVKLMFDLLPQETSNNGLISSRLVSIKGKKIDFARKTFLVFPKKM
jgi:hypothetical protein